MKPLKATTPIARWILRLTLLVFLYFNYFAIVKGLNYKSLDFYFASVYFISGIMLIIGAFLAGSTMTLIASLLIFLLSVYQIIKSISGIPGPWFLDYLIPASISFFFLSTGNESS